jgi:REP element-mobilizing transposase RayT
MEFNILTQDAQEHYHILKVCSMPNHIHQLRI